MKTVAPKYEVSLHMRVVKPINILAGSNLIGSNLSENDYPAYIPSNVYGIRFRITYNNRNYESLFNAFSGMQPDQSPDYWLDIGPTNRAASFDNVVGTQTVNPALITYQIKPLELVSVVALLNVQGKAVKVTVNDDIVGLVYDRTIATSNSSVNDWHQYFFAPYSNKSTVIFDNLPAYAGAVITITIMSDGNARVGTIIVGQSIYLGNAKRGLSLGITDYSRKRIDAFGNADILVRSFSSKVSVTLSIKSAQVDYVYNKLAELRSMPCLYLCADGYESTYVYGYYSDFNLIISSPIESVCSMELRGLI